MSTVDRSPRPGPTDFLRRSWTSARDWPAWAFVGGLVAILALAITVAVLLFSWLHKESPPPLRLGQEGTTGPFDVQVGQVACGKSKADIPAAELERMREIGFPADRVFDKGQLCFAKTRLRNHTEMQRPALVLMVLSVGDREFPQLGAFPSDVPFLFPDEAASETFVFQIPSEASPTKLRVQGAPNASSVAYRIP